MKLINKKGFSLMEIMITIAILIILTGLIISNYDNIFGDTNVAVLKTNVNTIRDALNSYYSDKRMYPQSLHTLTLGNAYLSTIPVDPYTKAVDYELKFEKYDKWMPYKTTPANSWGGIIDIRSRLKPDLTK
jgi:general secretion pathway protein G